MAEDINKDLELNCCHGIEIKNETLRLTDVHGVRRRYAGLLRDRLDIRTW